MITIVSEDTLMSHPRVFAKNITTETSLLCYNIKRRNLMICKVNNITKTKVNTIKVKPQVNVYEKSKTVDRISNIVDISDVIYRIQYNVPVKYKLQNIEKEKVDCIQIEMEDVNCIPLVSMEMFIMFVDKPLKTGSVSKENNIKDNEKQIEENVDVKNEAPEEKTKTKRTKRKK